MQLFELFATLSLNSRGFENALGGATGKVGGLIKSLGLTTATLKVVEQGFSKMSSMVSGAVDNFADYEQLVDGVKTLFKDSSAKVQAYAKEAYKNAGLSANEYMAVTTNFSASLIKALDGDTETAAELSNMAIVDMSDNVNKMGSSMEAVQNAYRGFARGNFTMLDNLQLGYSGTKEGMVELINDSGILNEQIDNLDDVSFDTMIKAIHKVQEDLGITGTTADEAAKTISGSKASMKAAFDDLLTSVAIGDQVNFDEKMANFQESFITYMNDNLMPTVIESIGGSGALIHGIFNAITQIPPDAFVNATVAAEHSLGEVFKGGSELLGWVGDTIVAVLTSEDVADQTAKLGQSIGSFVSDAINWVGDNASDLFGGLFDVGGNLIEGIIGGLFDGLFGTDAERSIAGIDQELADATNEANATFNQTERALMTMQLLVENYGTAAKNTQAWNDAVANLPENMKNASDEMIAHADQAEAIADAWIHAAEEERNYKLAQAQKSALEQKEELLIQKQAEFDTASNDLMLAEQATGIYYKKQEEIVQQFESDLQERGFDLSKISYGGSSDYSTKYTGINALVAMYNMGERGAETLAKYGITDTSLLADYQKYGKWGQEANAQQVIPAQEAFNLAEKELAQAQEAYDKQLVVTTESEKVAQETANSGKQIGDGITSAGNQLIAGLLGVSVKLPSTLFVGGGGGGNRKTNTVAMAYDVGSDYIPYDQYAYIHKGEAVLTAAEASVYRKGSRYSQAVDYGRIGDMIADSLGSVGLYVSGDKVANLTTDRMETNINQRKNHTLRGMGG